MSLVAEELKAIETVVLVTAGGACSVKVCDPDTDTPTALVAVKVKIHWSFENAEETVAL
jgi:hypothetical protein